jgi:hypothetical protein
LAVVVANLIAIPLGTISALKQNSPIDLVIRTISINDLNETETVLPRRPAERVHQAIHPG